MLDERKMKHCKDDLKCDAINKQRNHKKKLTHNVDFDLEIFLFTGITNI